MKSENSYLTNDQVIETTTTFKFDSPQKIYQVIHQHPTQQPLVIQVISKDEIEKPLKEELKKLQQKISQLVEENGQLYQRLNALGDQLKDKQQYIDTYRQKYIDMEQSKSLLVSELEKLNQQVHKQYNILTPRLRSNYSDNSDRPSQLEIDKLKSALNNKEEEIERLQEKFDELQRSGIEVLQDKLIQLQKETEYWKQKYQQQQQRQLQNKFQFA